MILLWIVLFIMIYFVNGTASNGATLNGIKLDDTGSKGIVLGNVTAFSGNNLDDIVLNICTLNYTLDATVLDGTVLDSIVYNVIL